MTTVYLDKNMVPEALRRRYSGKQFKARVCETMTIPASAGLWSGGSRDSFQVIHLETGESFSPIDHAASPWEKTRVDVEVKLIPGMAVVEHTIFSGKDFGLTFYIHPDNAAKLLPPPAALTPHERTVLVATKSLKSSYNGRDRYQMAHENSRYDSYCRDYGLAGPDAFPTRQEWDTAKATLIGRGLLNKAGAITVAGRNAVIDKLDAY